MPYDHDAIGHQIVHHLEQVYPGRSIEPFQWKHGPILKVLPNFRVLRIAPSRAEEAWVYVSAGAWEVTAESPWGAEFVVLSPVEDAIHVETLAMVGHYHADPGYRLNVGSTLNVGRPWMDAASCSRFLVSLPYFAGPRLEVCDLSDRRIRFLWLLPVTDAEWAFLKTHGQEALEQELEEAAIDPLDRTRKSVV
jgi:hypothetical protein